MLENVDANGSPSQNDENTAADYLRRASQACAAGDAVLGMHLYLAAFEKAASSASVPNEAAVNGLRQAWALACRAKERSLAEYIFEKMEPYLASDEVAACAEQLQRLALDKLEEFGLTREDLEDMTDMISQDFLGIDAPARLMKVEHVTIPRPKPSASRPSAAPSSAEGGPGADGAASSADAASPSGDAPAAAPSASSDESEGGVSVAPAGIAGHPAANGASEASPAADAPTARKAAPARTDAPSEDEARASFERAMRAAASPAIIDGAEGSSGGQIAAPSGGQAFDRISYQDLAGYDGAIALMRDFGVGMQKDAQFQKLVSMLNARHGLDRMPASDTLLFRSPAREDAHRFMLATLGELDLPAIRMHMEENLQGMPVLCVMAQADNQPKLNSSRNAFEGAGVLLLEDLDLWASPVSEAGDAEGGFLPSALSRGAREAINLIRSAVENPDVFVLASSGEAAEIDPFFCDLLEPISVVDIEYPTPAERADIWMEIARDHPSLRAIDRAALVRYSEGMPRYDMYMAAREAIEEAYKASLVARRCVPVTKENLFDKLAAYQPLDSEEYRALEDAVVASFRRDLEHIDDLLKGPEER